MATLRLLAPNPVDGTRPCDRCGAAGCRWDRLGSLTCCPDCQEALALGEAPPLRLAMLPASCSICGHQGSVTFATYPLGSQVPLAMELCAGHLRALLARALEPRSYRTLRRALQELRLTPRNVFLLHEAFYDDLGQALQPVLT